MSKTKLRLFLRSSPWWCVLVVAGVAGAAAQTSDQATARSGSALAHPAQESISIPPEMARRVRTLSPTVHSVIDPVREPSASVFTDHVPEPVAAAPLEAGLTQVSVDMAALKRATSGVGRATVFREGNVVDVSNALQVPLAKGEFLSIRNLQAQPISGQVAGATQVASPTSVIAVDSHNVTRQLALMHRTVGLTWNPAQRQFMGVLLVGLIDREHPGQEAGLDNPIPVQVLAPGDSVSPSQLSINRIGGLFQRVDVAIANPEDPFSIRLVSRVDPDLPDAKLPLRRTPLVLMAPAQIDALGVGDGQVTVRARDGQLRQGETVTLSLDNGDLQQATLTADESGVASTRVRSTRMGTGTLGIGGGPYFAEPVTIRYAFPLFWLLATLVGAMLGASIFVYALKKRSGRSRRKGFHIDWLAGVAVGIGVTAMAYAGMKLPAFIPMPAALAGVVVPFALAFVCAAMGSALIAYLTGRTS